MLELESLAIDPKKSRDGTWVSAYGAKFKIARFNNRPAEAERASLLADFYQKLSDRDGDKFTAADEAAVHDIQAKVMANHVLLDWKGIQRNGKELKYTTATAYKILRDDKYEDLFNFVVRESLKYDHFAAEQDKAIAKDVKPTASS